MFFVRELNVFKPGFRPGRLQQPGLSAVFSLQHVAARPDGPTQLVIQKADAQKMLQRAGFLFDPDRAAIVRVQNGALVSDNPAILFVDESNRVEMHCGARDLWRPDLPSRSRRHDFSPSAHGPSARAIEKENISQIVAAGARARGEK